MPKIVRLEEAPGERLRFYSADTSEEVAGTVGIPVRDHLNAETAMSIVASAMSGKWVGEGRQANVSLCQGSILTLQRNELVRRMRGDWLLFIDDDMVWQPEQLAQLIERREEHDLDMLGGLCFRRTPPHSPTLFMREAPGAGGYNFLEDWDPGEIIEVDATGMAFIVIHKRVFEMITRRVEGNPDWVMPSYAERMRKPAPSFFTWNGETGEDLRFCELAKACGARIWVDSSIEIGHVAETTIRYRDFLYQLAQRTPGDDDARERVNSAMGLPTVRHDEALRRLGL